MIRDSRRIRFAETVAGCRAAAAAAFIWALTIISCGDGPIPPTEEKPIVSIVTPLKGTVIVQFAWPKTPVDLVANVECDWIVKDASGNTVATRSGNGPVELSPGSYTAYCSFGDIIRSTIFQLEQAPHWYFRVVAAQMGLDTSVPPGTIAYARKGERTLTVGVPPCGDAVLGDFVSQEKTRLDSLILMGPHINTRVLSPERADIYDKTKVVVMRSWTPTKGTYAGVTGEVDVKEACWVDPPYVDWPLYDSCPLG